MEITQSGVQIILRPLEQADLKAIAAWGEHSDPLFRESCLPYRTEEDWQTWFKKVNESDVLEALAIENIDKEAVGIIALETQLQPNTLRVHIQIDGAKTKRGYGLDAMTTFYENIFPIQMEGAPYPESVIASTPAFNVVGISFLNRFGMVAAGQERAEFTLGREVFKIPEFRVHQRFFEVQGDTVFVTMKLFKTERIHWIAKREGLLAKRKQNAQARGNGQSK